MKYSKLILIAIIIAAFVSCEKDEDSSPPVAVFEISPVTGPFTQEFTFNAVDTYDPDESSANLLIRWDWEGDGDFDTDFSQERIFNHQYADADNYDVTMEVIDSDGWSSIEVKTLVVYADSVAPVASFEIIPDSASVNTIFYFSAGESTDQYTPVDQLEFRWDWQNDGTWDTPYTTDTSIYYKYENAGMYRVLMEVKNNITLTDTTSRVVYVYDL